MLFSSDIRTRNKHCFKSNEARSLKRWHNLSRVQAGVFYLQELFYFHKELIASAFSRFKYSYVQMILLHSPNLGRADLDI